MSQRIYVDENGEVFDSGHEYPDPKPLAASVGFTRPPSIQEMVQRLVRQEFSRQAEAGGLETFEEADDFVVGDDFDPTSPWELNFDQQTVKIPQKTVKPGMTQEEPAKGGGRRSITNGAGDPPRPSSPGTLAQYTFLMCTVLTDRNISARS